MDGKDKDAFAVNPTSTTSQSTVQLVVKDPQKLDFEKKEEMVVQVRCVCTRFANARRRHVYPGDKTDSVSQGSLR